MPDLFSRHSAELRRVREEERQRMARDIHDALGSSLAALKIEAHLIGETMQHLRGVSADLEIARLAHRVRTLQTDIDNVITASRELLRDHLPIVLQSRGLSAAISDYLQRFADRTGLACRFVQKDANREPSAEVALALYRVLQEALTNVHRHAYATQVTIALSATANHFLLEINDDGIGMPLTDDAQIRPRNPLNFGVLGMTERMRLIGGKLSITRGAKGGTRIACSAPARCEPDGRIQITAVPPRRAG